jgi:lipopolysaccharide transport system permease protein
VTNLTESPDTAAPWTTVIGGGSPLLIEWYELWVYRDLFYFLVWRDVKTRYAQSVLGVGWAVIQPVLSMIVFTIIFGKLARINSDGVPYAIFSFTALVPWTYFSASVMASGTSLITASSMITKVYFPRLTIPLSAILSKLVDFFISLIILFGLMIWYRISPTIWAISIPLLILLMMLTAAGIGTWITALSVQYRDVRFALSFAMQLLMYAAPVVYPASLVPEKFRLLYALNPMVGVIEGFRSSLLGTNPMPWDLLLVGSLSATVIALMGLTTFRRMERVFADVV